MGLEADLKKEVRMTKIRMTILTTLQVGGLLSLVVIAPNLAGLVGKHIVRAEREKTRSALGKLIKKGLVTKRKSGYEITHEGRAFLLRHALKPAEQQKWDSKWRMVIFDIPERRRAARAVLRDTLRRIGFLKLQNSAWVYPYDCEELVALLKTDYRLGKEVLYMVVDKLENDRALRDHFELRRR